MEATRDQSNPKPMHQGRFHTTKYLEEYSAPSSNTFKNRVRLLYTVVTAYQEYRHDYRWAKCCKTFERRVPQGSLGHPEAEMVPVSKLMKNEGIFSEADFEDFFLRTMPKNDSGDYLLPQCNMMHKECVAIETVVWWYYLPRFIAIVTPRRWRLICRTFGPRSR